MWRNRTVCLVGITMFLGATGCTFHESDGYRGGRGGGQPGPSYPGPGGGGARSGDSGVAVAWDLAYLDGRFTDCDAADTPTVTLRLTPNAPTAGFEASFPCDDGVGAIVGIPPGDYDVTLDLRDPLGRPVSTLTNPGIRVFGGAVTEPEAALIPVQTWDLLWTIGIEHLSGRVSAATCRDVGAGSVQFTARFDGETPEVYRLPCEDYGAVSTAIRPGDYEVRLILLDYQGRPIGDTGPGYFEVTFDELAELEAEFVF